MVYFDDTLLTHENFFLLFVGIPTAKKENWPYIENEELIKNAFDEFHNTSSFISLLPTDQNRNVYDFAFYLYSQRIQGRLQLKQTATFMAKQFQLRKVSNHFALLRRIKFGSISWIRFYEREHIYYGLFMKSYYVLYEDNPNSLIFRPADLGQIVFLAFKPHLVLGKAFLTDVDVSNIIDFIDTIEPFEKGEYGFSVFFRDLFVNIVFDLSTDNFQLFLENSSIEEVEKPMLTRLSQVGQKVYLIKKDSRVKLTVEIPVYFFGQKLEVSRLIISFVFIIEKADKAPSAKIYTLTYNFNAEQSGCWLHGDNAYRIYFKHFVEKGNLVFKPFEVECSIIKDDILIPIEIEKMLNVTNENNIQNFLNGVIIYTKESVVTLTGLEPYTKELDSEKYIGRPGKKHTNKFVYLLFAFILLLVCLFIKIYLFYYRNQVSKRNKFNRK